MPFFKTVDHKYEDVPQLPNKLLPFIWYFVRQMKKQLGLILLFFMISHAFVALTPYFVKIMVEGFETASDQPQELFNIMFWPIMFFLFFMMLFQPFCAQLANYIQARTLPVFANMVRRQVALYMHHHSYGYYQNDYAGRLAGKVVETPSAMLECLRTLLGAMFFAFIMYLVSISLYGSVDIIFAAIASTALIFYGLIMVYFVPRVQKLSHQASEQRSVVRGRFVDTLSNILTVKLFARKAHEDSYLLESLQDTAQAYTKMDLMLWRLWTAMEIWTVLFWLFTFWFTLTGWQEGDVSTAEAAMILPLTIQVTQTCWWMSEIFASFFQRLGEIREGMDAIVKSHDVIDDRDAPRLSVNEGRVHFDHVHFGYDGKELFSDLNLDIKPGEKIGLVGPSGAGKSSLVQILLRLYDIQDGAIKIDGQNIAKVQQDSLRAHIAVIPQMADMLHRTIRDNIMYGRLNATEEEMIEAAKRAKAHDFILDLVDQHGNRGYDSLVGERGVKLSGGQRQRVAIARAILKDAPILVLDEATSALDSESERAIQESLEDLMQGKTVLAIAHRLSTIAHMDRLIVMHQGQIIEEGTHDELIMHEDGHYAKLWAMQSGGFLKE